MWPYPCQGQFILCRLGLAMINLHTKSEIFMFTQYKNMKGNEKCRIWGGLGSCFSSFNILLPHAVASRESDMIFLSNLFGCIKWLYRFKIKWVRNTLTTLCNKGKNRKQWNAKQYDDHSYYISWSFGPRGGPVHDILGSGHQRHMKSTSLSMIAVRGLWLAQCCMLKTRKLCYRKDDHAMHRQKQTNSKPQLHLRSHDSRLTKFNPTLWT